MAPSPYDILGISPNADAAAIRGAYHRMALKYHPDKIQDPTKQAAGAEKFKDVQAAYGILKDSTKRATFDREYTRKHQHRHSQRSNTQANNKAKPSQGPNASGEDPMMYLAHHLTAISALRTADSLVADAFLNYAIAKATLERAVAANPPHYGHPNEYKHLFDVMPVSDYYEATHTTASAWLPAISSGRRAIDQAITTLNQRKQAVMAFELALKSFDWCAAHTQGAEKTEMMAQKMSCAKKLQEARTSAGEVKHRRKLWEDRVRGWEMVRNEWLYERAKFTPSKPQ